MGEARRGGAGQVHVRGEGVPGGEDQERVQEATEGAAGIYPGQAGQLLQGRFFFFVF